MEFKPSTLAGLKRLAKKIKKEKGIIHAEALEEAAKVCGFQNYRHALKNLRSEK